MNSIWREVIAVIWKDVISDWRQKNSLLTTFLFSFSVTVALGLTTTKDIISPTLAAGLLWIAFLFASITSATRSFLSEEETGTGDLLRVLSSPVSVFIGKCLYHFILLFFTLCIVTGLFVLFSGVSVKEFVLFFAVLISSSLALSSGIVFCSALASKSSGRFALAGVISIPTLIWILAPGITALRISFGAPTSGGLESVLAILGMGIAYLALGILLFPHFWKQ